MNKFDKSSYPLDYSVDVLDCSAPAQKEHLKLLCLESIDLLRSIDTNLNDLNEYQIESLLCKKENERGIVELSNLECEKLHDLLEYHSGAILFLKKSQYILEFTKLSSVGIVHLS